MEMSRAAVWQKHVCEGDLGPCRGSLRLPMPTQHRTGAPAAGLEVGFVVRVDLSPSQAKRGHSCLHGTPLQAQSGALL